LFPIWIPSDPNFDKILFGHSPKCGDGFLFVIMRKQELPEQGFPKLELGKKRKRTEPLIKRSGALP
jgi:hypothetical protein